MPSKLRILVVVPTYFPAVRYGGPIRSVHALAKALVARGHEVQVFTSSVDGPNDLDFDPSTPVDLDGVRVRYFPVRFLRRLYWSPPMAAALRKEVADFDVLHLHSVFLWPTWSAARIARSRHVPYIVSPRGSLGREVIRRKSTLIKSAWIQLIEQRTLRESAGVHATSEIESDEIKALGLKLPQIFCVPNGVEAPDGHVPLSAGPYADIARPYALFLGRINWKKGLDRLLKAWQLMPDLTLIIAGNDEEGYRPKLEAMAREYQVDDRVRFLGPVSEEHKWALYENAELFVLPSYSENFANVIAEAMIMGCPVVVTPEVGLSTFVRESGAGIVVDGAAPVLGEAIRALAQDSKKRAEMGSLGRNAVRRHLSWDSVAQRMESLLAEVRRAADPEKRVTV
ncbi:MAG TPA: glycosyltransferase [Steroidobacteraceae bacterium]|jgi:glycosyltransferase involved in cell wall biosynthesis